MQSVLGGLQRGVGRVIRTTGQILDSFGQQLEVNPHIDRLLPQTRVVKLRGHTPVIREAFIAPSATVIGKVTIGSSSSVWYGAVLRGDDNSITIGDHVTVGDRVMIHASKAPKEAPTLVQDRAIIQAGAILHGCTIEAGAVIGEGAQVLDNARVGAQAVLLPGSFLAGNKVIPPRQVWAGVPAKFQRELTAEEVEAAEALVAENLSLAVAHAKETAKTWQEIEHDEFEYEQTAGRSPEYYRRLSPQELSVRLGEVEGHTHPGRVLDSPVSAQLEQKN